MSTPERANAGGTSWRRSSYSGDTGNGNCVEIGFTTGAVVAVRDSKNTAGPVLAFAADRWCRFLGALG